MLRFAFELTEAAATLSNLNTRTEKQGKGKPTVPACDLRLSADLTPDVLAFFEPTLKAHLFNQNAVDLAGDAMQLRDPHMIYPLKRDESMKGATVLIHYGVDKPMEFEEANVKDFAITPKNGGTVRVEFTVQCKPDAHKQLPHLYILQSQAVTVTVRPPELAEMKAAA